MKACSTESKPPLRNYAGVIGIAFVIYLALGGLGLCLSVPPGYASPIFPAAGFAVAIMLWSANRAWPGIWLGSLALNLSVAWAHGDLSLINALTAAGIAGGSTLQALVASKLVERSVEKSWSSLEQEKDILHSLFWSGPVACVISATAGVSVLYTLQIIPASAFVHSWWNWWVGDTLGVVVVMPLVLGALYRHESPWRKRLITLVLPMLITLGVVFGAYFVTAEWEKKQQEIRIQEHGEKLEQVLKHRFVAHQEALSALRRLIEVTPEMTFKQFEYFTAITLRDNPDIFALSFNPYVTALQREAFEKRMANRNTNARFEIKERDPQRQLVRAGKRSDFVVVSYIAPLKGNLPAIGFDINSEPVRHSAIENAKKSRSPSVTAPIQLVQESKERIGALVLHPAYQLPQASGEAASVANLIGFAVGVIKVDEMIGIATRSVAEDGLVYQIDDVDSNQTIYRSHEAIMPGDSRLQWRRRLTMADRIWEMKIWPTHEYIEQHRPWTTWIIGATGLSFSALLQLLMLIVTGHANIVERKVQEQTRELLDNNATVQDRNAQLDAMFTLSPDGFVAFAPDGRIKFANPAFQFMTGISLPELDGQKTEADLEARLRNQMKHPESFSGIASCFAGLGEKPVPRILILQQPRHRVLQLVGIRSEATSVSRILYLRDITSEAEVDRMKSEFLSHAAHELRTPMASIYGFSELLLEMEFDEVTRRDLLETIHRQSRWLVDIINELLDLARIEAQQGKDFTIKNIDVKVLVADALHNLSFDPERWPVTLALTETIGSVIRADSAKISQALINVLNNAQKYSPDGGTIHIEIVTKPGCSGIAVSDFGVGMTPDQIKHIGERFWRADSSGKIPGTGLGMTIVMEILQFHGGHVEVRSQPEAGTTVTLWLPNAEDNETP
ncbi:MAG: CHASE domain-containing protein [Betaproteobacteria bacterium]